MGLVIKKRNLKWVVIAVICVIIGGGICASVIKKQVEAKTAERVYREQLQTAYNREYKSLVSDYERYKESFEEAYSRSNRDYYRKQINKLVGKSVLTDSYSWSISDEEEKEILKLLEVKAWSKAYGLDD